MVAHDNVIVRNFAEHARCDEFAIFKSQLRRREVRRENAMHCRDEREDANTQQILFARPFLGLYMGD